MSIIKVAVDWRGSEADLMKRIARIVCFDDSGCVECDTSHGGYKWQLNQAGNNWWCNGIENGEITVAYRYGGGGNQPMMDALKVLLEWNFGKRE